MVLGSGIRDWVLFDPWIRDPGIVKKLLKIWSWDPGSEIRDPGSGKNLFRIPDPGVKKHPIPDPGSGSATLIFMQI